MEGARLRPWLVRTAFRRSCIVSRTARARSHAGSGAGPSPQPQILRHVARCQASARHSVRNVGRMWAYRLAVAPARSRPGCVHWRGYCAACTRAAARPAQSQRSPPGETRLVDPASGEHVTRRPRGERAAAAPRGCAKPLLASRSAQSPSPASSQSASTCSSVPPKRGALNCGVTCALL